MYARKMQEQGEQQEGCTRDYPSVRQHKRRAVRAQKGADQVKWLYYVRKQSLMPTIKHNVPTHGRDGQVICTSFLRILSRKQGNHPNPPSLFATKPHTMTS